MDKCELTVKEMYKTKSEISVTYKIYNDLKKEIDDINTEISKLVFEGIWNLISIECTYWFICRVEKLNEINRIKPSLKYKTKKEYEEMIA